MTDREQLMADLHFHRNAALFCRGSLRTEHRRAIEVLERKLVILDRNTLTPVVKLGQSRWRRAFHG